jgi:Asp-tRNA(Asn)/Glu-tRNA(Gln) amidotransferase A subunit family amidase
MSTERQPSAVEWLRRLQRRQISAVELVGQTAARIREADARVHAVVDADPGQQLEAAREADARRARGDRAPLLGLPLTIKDSIDVAGLRCTGGSWARERFVPARDATAVARLRAAGAIIMAKTNVPEYSSSYETDNAVFGRTVHPRDPERTPGGSSGGESALLGADASIAGVGLDGGGSIRVPSHYCGTVGIRPTVGRIPDTGSWPSTRDVGYRDLMCIGPMARFVEDLALLLPVMAGPDWIDPYAVPVPLGDPATVVVKGLKVGYYDHDGGAPVSPGTRAAVAAAARALADAGAEVDEVEPPPGLGDATPIFFALVSADGGERTLRDLEGARGRHHYQFRTLLEGFGKSLSVAEFFDVQGRLFAFRARLRQFLSAFDVIVNPVTTGPAPRHMEPPWGVDKADYFKYAAFNYTHAWSLAGAPVAVAPAGEEGGLPIGVQLVAQPYRDHVALAAAAVLEAALGGFRPRAPAPNL